MGLNSLELHARILQFILVGMEFIILMLQIDWQPPKFLMAFFQNLQPLSLKHVTTLLVRNHRTKLQSEDKKNSASDEIWLISKKHDDNTFMHTLSKILRAFCLMLPLVGFSMFFILIQLLYANIQVCQQPDVAYFGSSSPFRYCYSKHLLFAKLHYGDISFDPSQLGDSIKSVCGEVYRFLQPIFPYQEAFLPSRSDF